MLTETHYALIEQGRKIATVIIKAELRRMPGLAQIDCRSVADHALVRAAVGYVPSAGKFNTYAGRSIKNALRSEYRQHCIYKTRFNAHGDMAAVQIDDCFEEMLEGDEFAIHLENALGALQQLARRDRALIRKRYGLGCPAMSLEAIAAERRQSRRTVKKRLLSALSQLRVAISGGSQFDRTES